MGTSSLIGYFSVTPKSHSLLIKHNTSNTKILRMIIFFYCQNTTLAVGDKVHLTGNRALRMPLSVSRDFLWSQKWSIQKLRNQLTKQHTCICVTKERSHTHTNTRKPKHTHTVRIAIMVFPSTLSPYRPFLLCRRPL